MKISAEEQQWLQKRRKISRNSTLKHLDPEQIYQKFKRSNFKKSKNQIIKQGKIKTQLIKNQMIK